MKQYKHKKTGDIAKVSSTGIYSVDNRPGFCYHLPAVIVENSNDWEEIPEKQWEIISFSNKNSVLYEKSGSIFQCSRLSEAPQRFFTEDELLNNTPSVHINSIKRLSDGEIFSIGDKVCWKSAYTTKSFIITKFTLNNYNNTSISVWGKGTSIPECDFAKVIKEKTPILTTEDGVEIFDKDKLLYTIYNKFTTDELRADMIEGWKPWKVFSTKEARDEYILMNKPLLSLQEVWGEITDHSGTIPYHILELLKQLSKKKLNK